MLTHDEPIERPLCYNCGASVDGESGCTVVHCRSVIVVNAVVCDDICRVRVEVVGGASLNVVPDDVDPLVSFRRRLHVIKSDCVEEFVHDREEAEAPGLQALVVGCLEVQDLLAGSTTTDVAVAAAVVAGNIDVVVVDSRIVWDKFEASHRFDASSALVNIVDLLLS